MAEIALLRQRLEGLGGRWFAVLDGAQFDDLPASLFEGEFEHRPLYVDRGDGHRERELTAPHLVMLGKETPESGTLNRLFELIGERPAAVFWQCEAGADVLYRHLRTLNMVMIPKGIDDDRDGEEEAAPAQHDVVTEDTAEIVPASHEGDERAHVHEVAEQGDDEASSGEEETHEMVLFRHADANVMAQVIPALNEQQFARLFGPATAILFAPSAEWATGSGVMVAPRPESLPAAAAGMLRLDEAVMERVGDRRLAASRRNITAYLQDSAPEYVERLSDAELQQLIIRAERSGEEIGLTSEYGHGLWALLALITGGFTLTSPELRNHFASTDELADEIVEQLVEELAYADDEKWEEWAP